ncbi:hypothetical protein, partial [Rhodocaloribacter sp.]
MKCATRWFSLLLLLGLGLPAVGYAQCTIEWINAAGGNWNTAANWQDTGDFSNRVPNSTDDVCITLDAAYTVTLNTSPTVNSLTLGTNTGNNTQTFVHPASRVLTLNDNSLIDTDGVYDWQGGTLVTAAGKALTNAGSMTLSTGSNKVLNPATLVNTGTMTWTGGTFFIENGSTVDNQGLFDAQSNNSISPLGTGPNTVDNGAGGIFRKSAGTGDTVISSGITFVNDGTVEAQTGTVRFDGTTTHTDAVLAAALGAAVRFNSGTHTVVGTLSGNPDGAVFMDSGASLQADAMGGTLAFGGTGFDWQGGTIKGGTTLTNAGSMTLSTGSNKVLNPATLVNTGTMTWTGGTFFIENG